MTGRPVQDEADEDQGPQDANSANSPAPRPNTLQPEQGIEGITSDAFQRQLSLVDMDMHQGGNVGSTASMISSTNSSVFRSMPPLVPPCKHAKGIFCDRCTIELSSYSIPSGFSSAVSGVRTFDDETGEFEPTEDVAYECPFFYLRCNFQTSDKERWLDHCPSHFQLRGPPPNGSRCPLCKFHTSLEMLAAGEAMNEEERVAALDSRRIRTREARSEAESRQAWALWRVRQEHVAQHHEHGYSLTAAEPDPQMFKYLLGEGIIGKGLYKDLTFDPTGRTGTGPVTSTGDSRRESRLR